MELQCNQMIKFLIPITFLMNVELETFCGLNILCELYSIYNSDDDAGPGLDDDDEKH